MRVDIWLLNVCIGLPIAFGLLTPLKDPGSLEKYSISYVTPEYWQTAIKGNASALAEGYTLQIGDGLSCYLRQGGSNESSSSKREEDELEFKHLLEDNLQTGIDIIAENMKECLEFRSGYWTYDYCPEIGLSQFNGDLKTTHLYYVLGKPDQERQFQLLYNSFDYYISEILGSGTICDVTGNPRAVEIQYVCGAAAGSATIQSIKEVKTCYYEVQIALPQLCELELLSSSEEKKASNPILCVNDAKLPGGTVELLSRYDPIFMGSDFYLLEPQIATTDDQRKIVLYSGKHKIKEGFVGSSPRLYDNIGNAFSRMLYQQLLIQPGELDFKPGDEISWASNVVDLHGNYLTRLQFNLSSSSLANISLSNAIELPESGNLLYHRRGTAEANNKAKDFQFDPQAKKMRNSKESDNDVKLLITDINGAEDLFELSPEQLEAILKEHQVLGEYDTLEDLVKYIGMMSEEGGEVQNSFNTLVDELRQAGTPKVHVQESDIDASENARGIEFDDSQVSHDTDFQGNRQENVAAVTTPEDDGFQGEEGRKKEEESQNKPIDSENHLHDEL